MSPACVGCLLVLATACGKSTSPDQGSPTSQGAVTAAPPTAPPVAEAAAPSASTGEDSPPVLDNSPAAMAKVLAGIAQFQYLVQQRLALGREANAACLARNDARGARYQAVQKIMGGQERLVRRKTRYACCAPQRIKAPAA